VLLYTHANMCPLFTLQFCICILHFRRSIAFVSAFSTPPPTLVPRFPVSRFPPMHLWRCRVFRFHIFSRPRRAGKSITCTYRAGWDTIWPHSIFTSYNLIVAGLQCTKRSHAGIAFYSLVQKWVSPHRGDILLRWTWNLAKFHVYRGRNVGIQTPKPSKFRILSTSLQPWLVIIVVEQL